MKTQKTKFFVTYEQAKLLKEKKFDEAVSGIFLNEEFELLLGEISNTNIINPAYCSAPQQWEVIEWLRVNHGIWIVALPMLFNGTEISWYPSYYENGVGEDMDKEFETPQEAYSEALDYVLKNLI